MEEHPNVLFYRVAENVDDVVYQENMPCPIILGYIYSWKIVKLSDFMFLQGGGTPEFLNLQGGGTCA